MHRVMKRRCLHIYLITSISGSSLFCGVLRSSASHIYLQCTGLYGRPQACPGDFEYLQQWPSIRCIPTTAYKGCEISQFLIQRSSILLFVFFWFFFIFFFFFFVFFFFFFFFLKRSSIQVLRESCFCILYIYEHNIPIANRLTRAH